MELALEKVFIIDMFKKTLYISEQFRQQCTPPPNENQISVKKWTVLGDGSFCLLNLDSKTTLTFFGTYNASSALTFAKSRQCLRMSVQCVEKHLNPDPN